MLTNFTKILNYTKPSCVISRTKMSGYSKHFCLRVSANFDLEVLAQFGLKKSYKKNYQNLQRFLELYQLFIHNFLSQTVPILYYLYFIQQESCKLLFTNSKMLLFIFFHLMACNNSTIL